MIIQDTINTLTEHLTVLQSNEDAKNNYNEWQLISALEFAIKVLKEKVPVEKEPDYIPVCPRGFTDCVRDPAYIKYEDPEWYKELYGDMTPEEAIHKENGCCDRGIEEYCYDDEDK